MSTITINGDKIELRISNGDMFAVKATIDKNNRERHFLTIEQKSHNGAMRTIIDKHGSLLLCSTLVDVLSELDDNVGKQLYEILHKKYGNSTAIDEIITIASKWAGHKSLPSDDINKILKKHKLI